jgi:NAD(P)-dependent dehydrogenase (short-subunit alcohol dehydrogenase family)
MNELERGTVAIVTGATGGIGLAIVSAIAAQGVSVACINREGVDFAAALDVCAAAGVEALALEADVRDRDGMKEAARHATSLGTVRYGVNCAGIDHLQPTVETTTADWNRVLDVNLSGVLFSCLAEYEVMREQGGSIVNVASASGTIYNRGALPHSGYSASKAGVIQLSRTLAVEWVPERIRVNAVSPGYTRTAMTDLNPPERNRFLADQSPMQRMAEVSEVADPVVFLLGSGAAFVNGVNLPIDGGLTVW